MLDAWTEVFRYPTLGVLIAMSVLALGVGLERVVFTARFRGRVALARQTIVTHLRGGKHTMAQAVNESLPWHPATPLFGMLLSTDKPSRPGEIKRAEQRVLRGARRRLWVLGSIGSIAPFVGLLGTVLGVMQAFRDIGEQGAGGFQVVSAGISEALVTTAAGIFVGVEAVLLFNYLKVCVAEFAAEIREASEEISETLEADGAVSSA